MSNNKRILIPIPTYGVDPSEVAIPWKILSNNNFEITFATPNGSKAETDSIMLNGEGLGLWKSLLAARKDAVDCYSELNASESFRNPIKYSDINEKNFDAIFLPGGHDKKVRAYLESTILQQLIVAFFNSRKPVAAVCHGVILVARSIDKETNKSVIYNYKTTSLLKNQELLAYKLTRYKLKDYYLTYPGLTVEDEVKSVLSDDKNFHKGPLPILRDRPNKLKRGYIVRDRNYVSGRWPGDVYLLSHTFVQMINE